jgi:hypothetical protein
VSIHSVFEEIEASLANLEIDEIKRRLDPIFIGMAVEVPIVDPGTFLYRARKLDGGFNKASGITRADLMYPPKACARMGRLNRPNESMFYCSTAKEALFLELQDLKPGDELVLTIWQTTEKMFLNNIGYTQYVFDKLGAKRPIPTWGVSGESRAQAVVSFPDARTEQARAAIASDSNREIREHLSAQFTCQVTDANLERYKLTVAIAELHLGTIIGHAAPQFAGLAYPSVRASANSDNLALLPWFVDQHLRFRKAVHARIDTVSNSMFSITSCDAAKEFDDKGQLRWLGRLPNWQLPPGHTAIATGTAGRDEDGDYESAANGEPCHWVIVDQTTGKVLPAQ